MKPYPHSCHSGAFKRMNIPFLMGRAAASVMLSVLLLSGATLAAPGDDAVIGYWRFDNDGTLVEIKRCDQAICGEMLASPTGTFAADTPDLLCGHKLFGGLRGGGQMTWVGGWIHDPEDDKRYQATLRQESPNTLKLRAYVWAEQFGETYLLKRVGKPEHACRPVR